MTESEINARLRRVYASFDDKANFKPEEFRATIDNIGGRVSIRQDFAGGRSRENLEVDAISIINEIMGIRDRAKAWLKNRGDSPRKVDDFIKSELAVSLVHDLANTDKHGKLDAPSFSGYKPKIKNVVRGVTLAYDPSTGTYASEGQFVSAAFNIITGEIIGSSSSSNLEVTLASDIEDEAGNKIGELQKVLPDAIYKWEQFLISEGLTIY